MVGEVGAGALALTGSLGSSEGVRSRFRRGGVKTVASGNLLPEGVRMYWRSGLREKKG